MPSDATRSPSVAERLLWASLAAGGFAVLVTAAWIEPDPRGYGTHTQLGLPPCGFLALTGSPCPGCGLTTAFAYAARGQWWLAGTSNPLGLVLFLIVCATVPMSVLAIVRGWSFAATVDRLSLDRWALAVAGCGVVLWVVRFASAL
ncbi:MAG: DUF2752 domain-containing protein [Myxococcales bacterium]|nr:DUF2752 domain-containing protein [Myxococcales bacterium]MDH3485244.1 DUF2752 domain-containing protein [Myxococcales bacterium]